MISHAMNGFELNASTDRREALSELERISGWIRSLSTLIMLATLVTIALALVSLSAALISRLSPDGLLAAIFSMMACTACAVIAAVGFDFFKRKGDACFEELSDELHGAKTPDDDFSLGARIIMRNYSNHASLPLIPGRFGPAIIVGINILLPFLVLISIR